MKSIIRKPILLMLIVLAIGGQHRALSMLWFNSLKENVRKLLCDESYGLDPISMINSSINLLTKKVESQTIDLEPLIIELDLEDSISVGEIKSSALSFTITKNRASYGLQSSQGLGGLLLSQANEANIVHQNRKLSTFGEKELKKFGSGSMDYYRNYCTILEHANQMAQLQVKQKSFTLAHFGQIGEFYLPMCLIDIIFSYREEFQRVMGKGRSTLEMMATIYNLNGIYNKMAPDLLPALKDGFCPVDAKYRGAFVREAKSISVKVVEKLANILLSKLSPTSQVLGGKTIRDFSVKLLLYVVVNLVNNPPKCKGGDID